MAKTIEQLESEINLLKNRLDQFSYLDRFIFQRDIEIFDQKDITFSKTTGTRIGTNTAEKFSFWNVTPVNQPDTVAEATGGGTIDSQSRTAIAALISRLKELGLIA